MSYFITTSTNIETSVTDNTFQTLLEHSFSGLEVDSSSLVSVKILAGTSYELILPNVDTIVLLAVEATALVDVATTIDALSQPYYTGCPTKFFLKANDTGFTFDKVLIKASAEDALVKIAYAVNYPAL